MEGMPQNVPRTVEDVFSDFKGRRAGLIRALTSVSTEKLKQRLQEEGVSEAAVQDSEQSMRNEFAALQSQLMLLKQKQWQLIDTLRHLEERCPGRTGMWNQDDAKGWRQER